MIHDSYYYNWFTINKIIIIIIQSENDNKLLNWDIIIQYWINQLQWISQYSLYYISMHYSLIFPYNKKKWYSFISFIDINLTNNNNLYIYYWIYINSKFKNDNDDNI